jgi:hypothetical protein
MHAQARGKLVCACAGMDLLMNAQFLRANALAGKQTIYSCVHSLGNARFLRASALAGKQTIYSCAQVRALVRECTIPACKCIDTLANNLLLRAAVLVPCGVITACAPMQPLHLK